MKNVPPLFADNSYVEFLTVDLSNSFLLPLYASCVSAGFPSPAEDYVELRIDIGKFVTNNPTSTFFVKVHGDSMQDAHIVDGSILAVDKSIKPESGKIILAVVNSEFTVKRLERKGNKTFLLPENKKYLPVEITGEIDFQVWGVVVTILHKP